MTTPPERRQLTFANLDEVVSEAQRLATGPVRVSGSHSFGQILHHLALSQDVSTGRVVAPPPPLMIRLLMPLMKRMIINSKPLKPGVKLPPKAETFFWPDKEFEVSSALQNLIESTENYQSKGPLAVHPFFGRLTKEEADQLNCRHAALHLSFVHPA